MKVTLYHHFLKYTIKIERSQSLKNWSREVTAHEIAQASHDDHNVDFVTLQVCSA